MSANPYRSHHERAIKLDHDKQMVFATALAHRMLVFLEGLTVRVGYDCDSVFRAAVRSSWATLAGLDSDANWRMTSRQLGSIQLPNPAGHSFSTYLHAQSSISRMASGWVRLDDDVLASILGSTRSAYGSLAGREAFFAREHESTKEFEEELERARLDLDELETCDLTPSLVVTVKERTEATRLRYYEDMVI